MEHDPREGWTHVPAGSTPEATLAGSRLGSTESRLLAGPVEVGEGAEGGDACAGSGELRRVGGVSLVSLARPRSVGTAVGEPAV